MSSLQKKFIAAIVCGVLFIILVFSRGDVNPAKAAYKEKEFVPVRELAEEIGAGVAAAAEAAAAAGAGADVEKRDAIKAAMEHAWSGYVQYAWGADDLKPVSKSSANWLNLGATIIDSLDTLYVMGMEEEFNQARKWVAEKLDVHQNRDVSFFETTIRDLGGLLAAYDLTGDEVFLLKADELAQVMLPVFDTPSGLPRTTINLKTQRAHNPSWNSNNGVLSEMGTIQLEFNYLSCKTGNPVYRAKAEHVFQVLTRAASQAETPGLLPVSVATERSVPTFTGPITLGALGDSYYEYLIKYALQSGEDEWHSAFQVAAEGIGARLVQTSSPSGHVYVAELSSERGQLVHKMDHLACFAAGMFMLGSDWGRDREMLDTGLALADTCYQFYRAQPAGIGPEVVHFRDGQDFNTPANAKHYLLRPEAVEAMFYAWRFSGEAVWRERGWAMWTAIDRECRADAGFSGIRDVTRQASAKDDTQQSFFLAETLKYLYLLFDDPATLPLTRYAFNTEAHPLRYPLTGCADGRS